VEANYYFNDLKITGLLAWQDNNLVIYGELFNTTTCNNTYASNFLWWDNQNNCFHFDEDSNKVMGLIISAVKGKNGKKKT
jgi:hypothetical protein